MDEHTAYEQAYRNGKEYMRSVILDRLKKSKTLAIGVQRFVYAEIVEWLEKLEVKP